MDEEILVILARLLILKAFNLLSTKREHFNKISRFILTPRSLKITKLF
jgi:hypothetical protein